MTEWQTIDTAPRDGTRILIAVDERFGVISVREGRWNKEQNAFTSPNGFLLFTSATHWMPLPPPPSGSGET